MSEANRVVPSVDSREMKDRTWLGIIALAVLVLVVLVYGAGTAQSQVDPDQNHPEYWGETCVKIDEYQGGSEWVSSDDYALVVLKSGTNSWEFESVTKGQVLTTPDGKDISHIIVCLPSEGTTTTTTLGTTTSTEEVTTTTVVESTTTSTVPASSTTVSTNASTTIVSTSPTTPPSSEVPTELPYTGAGSMVVLAAAATALIATGVAALRHRNDEDEGAIFE